MLLNLLGCTGGGGLFLRAAVVLVELRTLTKLPIELEVFVLDGKGGRFESERGFDSTSADLGSAGVANFPRDACVF